MNPAIPHEPAGGASVGAEFDACLVTAYRETGDPEIFGRLVERYEKKAFRLAASILGPALAAEAEDVTQEAFLRAFDGLERFRGDSKFGSWLYAIVRNLALDRRSAKRSRAPHLGEAALATQPSGDDPRRDLARKVRDAALARAIEGLPELYRTALTLHYWLEAPVAEIAELLGVAEGTAKSYLFRGRERLRSALTPEDFA